MTDDAPTTLPADGLGEGELPPEPQTGAPDVADLPGGALAALEAVLMVADEPVPAVRLATVLGLPTGEVVDLLAALQRSVEKARGGAATADEAPAEKEPEKKAPARKSRAKAADDGADDGAGKPARKSTASRSRTAKAAAGDGTAGDSAADGKTADDKPARTRRKRAS